MSGTRDWDAGTYDRVSGPQVEWAVGVIDRLGLQGDEAVLDAGCGSGRVTELLLERLPRGSVIAVDGSESMVAQAAQRLDPERTTIVHSDLLEIDLAAAADAVFSNAVFHWIHDHERLFAVLHRALRPGGRLEAQCGGAGNIANVVEAIEGASGEEPFRRHLDGFDPHHFATPEETERILRGIGYESVKCGLLDWPVHPPEPREYIRSVCLGAHSELLPEELRTQFLDEVERRLGPEPVLGYVRLNISAQKKGGPGLSRNRPSC